MNLYLVLVLFVTIINPSEFCRTFFSERYPITYLQANRRSLEEISCQSDPHHTMCHPLSGPLSNCTKFQLLTLNNKNINSILIGLNGFRTREVTQEYYQIANMHLLYWDPDLAEMALQYVLRCDLSGQEDLTKYIGHANYTIGQTYFFSKKFPTKRWTSLPVNTWYRTFSSVNDGDQFSTRAKFTPYTQIIWPTTKFVGCAGARVAQGLLFVCYFGPGADKSNIAGVYIQGEPCTACDPQICSKSFRGLCGTDYVGLGSQLGLHLILIGFVSLRASVISWNELKSLLS